jgi:hypothetical protein
MSGHSNIKLQRLSVDDAERDKLPEDETQAAENEPLLAGNGYVNLSPPAINDPMLIQRLDGRPAMPASIICALGSLRPTLLLHARELFGFGSLSDELC